MSVPGVCYTERESGGDRGHREILSDYTERRTRSWRPVHSGIGGG